MSTRTNIVIRNGKTKVYLYRHSDGYPACNGIDLAEAMAASKNVADLLVNLLSRRYEATKWRPEKPIYEVTTDLHGDIEWIYVICQRRDGKGFRVGWQQIELARRFEGFDVTDDTVQADRTLDAFTSFVKSEEAKMLDRIAAYEARNKAEVATHG